MPAQFSHARRLRPAGADLPAITTASHAHVVLMVICALSMTSALVLARAGDRLMRAGEPHPVLARAPLANAEAKARGLTAALWSDCPITDSADSSALERCRDGLQIASVLRVSLGAVTLWGRQLGTPAAPLADSSLSRVPPSVLVGSYLPRFMYDGRVKLDWSEMEGLWRVELGARLREGGSTVEPQSHAAASLGAWSIGYEHTVAIVLWLTPDTRTVRAVQASLREPVRLRSPAGRAARARTSTLER